MKPHTAAALATAATLTLAAAPADAGPYTTVTPTQIHRIHHGQTRWYVEHQIFHNATGLQENHWPGHQTRLYRKTNGGFLQVTYHRATTDHGRTPWRVTHKQNATD